MRGYLATGCLCRGKERERGEGEKWCRGEREREREREREKLNWNTLSVTECRLFNKGVKRKRNDGMFGELCAA